MHEIRIRFAAHRCHVECDGAVACVQKSFQINEQGETRWILFDRQIDIRVFLIHEYGVIGEDISKCSLKV